MRKGLDKNFTIFIGGVILTVAIMIVIFGFAAGTIFDTTPTLLTDLKETFSWLT